MTSYRSRLARGLSANVASQAITVFIQLVSVPVFLSTLGNEEYGKWLILSAIPSYLMLIDGGVLPVTINRVTELCAAKRYNEANECFQSGLAFLLCATAILLATAAVIVLFVPLSFISHTNEKITTILLTTLTAINLFVPAIDAHFRAHDKYAQGTYILAFGRLCEWLGGLAALLTVGGLISLACGMVVARFIFIISAVHYTSNHHKRLNWSIKLATGNGVRSLIGPGLNYMAIPLSSALSIQGMTIAIGSLWGSHTVAQFNTIRTLTRIPVQAATMLQRSFWPELSRAWGERDIRDFSRLIRSGTWLSLAFGTICAAILFFVATPAIDAWTAGRIKNDSAIFTPLMIAALLSIVIQVPTTAITCIGAQRLISIPVLALSLIPILVTLYLHLHPSTSAVLQALCDFSSVVVVIYILNSATNAARIGNTEQSETTNAARR
jgi:O-antigen/teichoic acid export membrane protein